ncbi:hypothetical protein OUZ56_003147 [Daphnia magna]|uniref:Uncharacterized protein n=1 Tax=Daphnia magna TaxID=35525 RepID=A0ABR0A7V8_9CRUS|nr:hypothetical protein OUZ56_003147 [Daphnia magna]
MFKKENQDVVLQQQNDSDVYTTESDTSESQESDVDGQLTQLEDENYEDNLDSLLSAKASEPCKDFTVVEIVLLFLNPHSPRRTNYLNYMPCSAAP